MSRRWHLFEVTGIEIEYMIANAESMLVKPVAEMLLQNPDGAVVSEVNRGALSWSNELVAHVLEIKTTLPVPSIPEMRDVFQESVRLANRMLRKNKAILLPSGAHPFMNPDTETVLWPHEHTEIYQTYDRIFSCKGHGWSNLQSVHLNLPFFDDDEFGRLHAAIRASLPLLPAIAASTPVLDGQFWGAKDLRLKYYDVNQASVPVIAGQVIPEPVFTEADYNDAVFKKVAAAIALLDPEGVLDPYFLNSRGAIARFDRGSIEIRILDAQECVTADLALAEVTVALVKALANERFCTLKSLKELPSHALRLVYDSAIHSGLEGLSMAASWNRMLGAKHDYVSLENLWRLLAQTLELSSGAQNWLEFVLENGNLADRMLAVTGRKPTRETLQNYLKRLSDCLENDRLFEPTASTGV